MKISAIITLKKDVLDPQGKVIHQALDGMGFNSVNEVRQGKYFETPFPSIVVLFSSIFQSLIISMEALNNL